MNSYISRFLDEANAGKVQECLRLSKFDAFSERDIVENAALLNASLMAALKENLHNLKGKYLYEFMVGAYQKGTRFSILFSAADVILSDDESLMDASNSDESEKGTLHPAMNMDVFLLSVSHLTSLMQQQISTEEQKSLVQSILRLIALFAEQKEIQNICRRQKFLTTFLKLFSEVVLNVQPNEFATADESHLAVLTSHILAKLLLRSKKNQEYLLRKKAHEMFKPMFLAGEKNILMFSACAGILINLASTNEARQLLWSSGLVGISKKSIQNSTGNLRIAELNYILLSRLAHECADVVDDFVKDETFLQQLNQILAFQDFQDIAYQKNENITTYGLALSIIRKIASFPVHRPSAKKYLKHPLNYINKISELFNGSSDKQQSNQSPNQAVQIFALKEAAALLTTLFIEEDGRQQGLKIQPRVASNLIKLSLQLFQDIKLVKIVLGCLTNLSASESGRQELSRENQFGGLISAVLEKYDENPTMIVLCLKLMLNNFSSSECVFQFNSAKILLKVLFLGFAYQKHVLIVDLSNKWLRFLCADASAIGNVVECYREYESANATYRFAGILVNHIKLLLSNGQQASVLDSLQLMACLCTVDKKLVTDLSDKTDFVSVVKDIIETKRTNSNDLYKYQSTLAYFPLEQFKALLTI